MYPSVQTSIEHTTEKDHYPISTMIESGPLEFTITGSGDGLFTPDSEYLGLRSHKPNRRRQHSTSQQLGSKSLLTDICIPNGKMVSSSSNTYAYRAYIETLFTFAKAYTNTFLINSMWYKDTA